MINKLMETGAGPGDAGKVTALADPRTNSLVLRAPSLARSNLAKSLITKLDQPTTELGNVHVVYLKNAEATKLAATLRSVVSGDTSSSSGNGSGAGNGLNSSNQNGSQGGLNGSNSGGANGQSGSGTDSSNGPSNPLLN